MPGFPVAMRGKKGFGIMTKMTATTKKLLERVASWPEEDIEKLEDASRACRSGEYHATADELRAVDEADRSGVAADAEVEAAFRTFRRA
jgi:hypothetical protein